MKRIWPSFKAPENFQSTGPTPHNQEGALPKHRALKRKVPGESGKLGEIVDPPLWPERVIVLQASDYTQDQCQ